MILTDKLQSFQKLQHGPFQYPDYDRFCLTNVSATILSIFGVEKEHDPLQELWSSTIEPGKYRNVILFFLDGFGFTQWQRYASQFDFLRRFSDMGTVAPITSVFPSSTAPAITSFHSGQSPMEHGLIEWWTYMREIDQIMTTLPFNPMGSEVRELYRQQGVDPKILFHGSTLSTKLRKAGVTPYSFLSSEYVKSAYNTVASPDMTFVSYEDLHGFVGSLRETLRRSNGKNFYYAYWSGIDNAAHAFGPHSSEYTNALEQFSDELQKEFFEKIDSRVADETLVLVTADHGQMAIDPETNIYLNTVPGFVDSLAVSPAGKRIEPWGMNRDMFIQFQEERIDAMIAVLQNTLKDIAHVVRSRDMAAKGLFGKGIEHPEFRSRIGNVMILPYDGKGVWYEHFPGKKSVHRGVHGGLTQDEMLIPFAFAPLSALL